MRTPEVRFVTTPVRFVRKKKLADFDLEDLLDDSQEDDEEEDGEDEDRSLITGFAAPYNSDSADFGGFVEQYSPRAFDRSLKMVADGDANVRVYWEHNTRGTPLGSTGSGLVKLTSTTRGLAFTLDPKRLDFAQLDAIRTGDMKVSAGFLLGPDDYSWSERSDGTFVRTLDDLVLTEFSFVHNPAYPETSARSMGTDVTSALASLENWRSSSTPEGQDKYRSRAIRLDLLKKLTEFNSK